jgi:hypothetical protein
MSTNQALFPIASMARVLGVSTAGYYAWRDRPPSAHAQADAALLKQVRTAHVSSRQIYGAPRIHAQLRADGAKQEFADRPTDADGFMTELGAASPHQKSTRAPPKVLPGG